jgi:4-coumarate--CoA ligase
MNASDRTTCSILGWDPNEKSFSASVGELNANCEAKIMAEDGVTELGRNDRGELWVRGQNIMKGYWRNPQATKETKTEDGWLKTGDIAYVDTDGKFHVVDRKKVRKRYDRLESAQYTNIDIAIGAHQSEGQPSCTGRT